MNTRNFIGLAITIILFGGLVFILLTKNDAEKQEQVESDKEITTENSLKQEIITPTSTKKEVPIADTKGKDVVIPEIIEVLSFPNNNLDTTDWQTHYADSFGDDIRFQIKYPKGWIVETHGENQAGPNASMVLYDKRFGEGADNGIYMVVKKISVEEFVLNNVNKLDYKLVKINNTYGYVVKDSHGGFVATSIVLSNKNNNKTYWFNIIGPDLDNPSEPKSYLEVFEQIILSFRLVE